MILRDRVTITETIDTGEYDSHGEQIFEEREFGEVPAHVGSASGSSPFESSWGTSVSLTELRAIIPPVEFNDDAWATSVTWRGIAYDIDAKLPIHRGGRLHHWTMSLKRATPGW